MATVIAVIGAVNMRVYNRPVFACFCFFFVFSSSSFSFSLVG
jgi:hypothetical protein